MAVLQKEERGQVANSFLHEFRDFLVLGSGELFSSEAVHIGAEESFTKALEGGVVDHQIGNTLGSDILDGVAIKVGCLFKREQDRWVSCFLEITTS